MNANNQPITINLFTDYCDVTDLMVATAAAARTDPRAIQNSRALFQALGDSLEYPLETTMLENIPAHKEGVAFFKLLTTFTELSSLNLAFASSEKLLTFNPADFNFEIPMVNEGLNELFILASTPQNKIKDSERIFHTLKAYKRIKQPERWAHWTREQSDSYCCGGITYCQNFHNEAVLKYNTIAAEHEDGKFHGSAHTVHEEVVAMIATNTKQPCKCEPAQTWKTEPANDDDKPPSKKPKLTPFVKHTRVTADPDSKKYVVGDTKEWEGTTYHFCDCPNHMYKQHWHTHPAAKCNTRQ